MGCSKVRYTCLLENERDMKQDSCFKNIWKINICNVGTLTVETLQVVLENRTYSLTASLYLRLGSRWRTPWELQHREREAQENSLLIQLDLGVLLTDLPAGNHMSRPHLFNIYFLLMCSWFMGFPGGSEGRESGLIPGSIPGSGRSSGEGNGNPPQHSCLENSMNRGALWARVHGITKSQT